MPRLIKPELQHYFGSFVLQTAHMAAMTLIPFFCFQHLGGRERSAALIYGVETLSLGMTCFLSAPFVSRWKNGLFGCLIGSLGFGIFYFFASFSKSVTAFCVLTGIAMSFFALAWPAMQSWLGAQPDQEKRTRSFSYLNLAIGLGLIVGPLVEGILYQVNFRAAFAAVLVLGALAAALLFTLPREKDYFTAPPCPVTEKAESTPELNSGLSEIYLYCGWLTNMLGWGLTGAVRTVYAGRLNDLVERHVLVLFSPGSSWQFPMAQHAASASALYSALQATLSLGYFAAILVLGRTTRWQHRLSVLVALEVVLGLSIWILAGGRSLAVIFACHAALGAFTGFGYLGSQCYSAANPALKHRRIAIQEGLSQSSGFAMPLIFAQCAASYGAVWPFKNAWLIILAYLGFQLLSLRYARLRFSRGVLQVQDA